jgi:hypothetical protein
LDRARCEESGGAWEAMPAPGGAALEESCRVGPGVRELTGGNGACADCHAPGIDGALGGRDLAEATGVAYRGGVHCDVCHHVAAVEPSAPAGVSGRLAIVRPSEPGSPSVGAWAPLAFGPLPDVLNPRMGAVYREEVFHGAALCGGCHELEQEGLVPGVSLDTTRWPEGRLPVHSTYSEWEQSGLAPGVPCQSCHMPPDPTVGNAADLYNHFQDVRVGVSAGWERPPGTVRRHAWYGPRQRESGMLELAATLRVELSRAEGATVEARVTTTNVGPGHALPTGEPSRQLHVRVEARCDGRALPAVGGDVVADFGGALATRPAGEDWERWPGAAPGEVIRVLRRTGSWVDYAGWGPFGDGRFSASEKGLEAWTLVGEARVRAVAPDGTVTLDAPLPEGDRAVRGLDGLPVDGDPAQALAGAPGWSFARVLVGADGARMVPHHEAVDVASDHRLLPGASWTSRHRFDASGCAGAVESRATLVHRAMPWALARSRGWDVRDSVMATASGSLP